MKISTSKKEAALFCCAYSCINKPIQKKGGLCHKHYARKTREKNPVLARYNQFCSNATRRGIYNDITLKEFKKFCEDTGYIIEKGNRGLNATIDRIDNFSGYTIKNIQLLTNKQNIRKYYDEDRFANVPF